MNKKVLTTIVVLIFLFGGGYLFMNFRSTDNSGNIKPTEDNSLFTSIKDALSKNVTLVCEFKDETGTSTKSYIKNGAVRVSSSGETNQAGEIIIKDKKMYMWDTKTKQGFVYAIPDEDGSEVGMTGSEISQSEAYLNMIDKYKDSCKVSTVEDSYFVAPNDIVFQDMSKLLENLKNQVPQTQ